MTASQERAQKFPWGIMIDESNEYGVMGTVLVNPSSGFTNQTGPDQILNIAWTRGSGEVKLLEEVFSLPNPPQKKKNIFVPPATEYTVRNLSKRDDFVLLVTSVHTFEYTGDI